MKYKNVRDVVLIQSMVFGITTATIGCSRNETISIPSAVSPQAPVANGETASDLIVKEEGASDPATGNQSVPPTTPNPSPVVQEIPNGDYKIEGLNSGKCFDFADGKVEAGLPLQVWECIAGNNHQNFTIQSVGTNLYRISIRGTTDLEGSLSSLVPNSVLQQGTPGGEANQQFSFERSARHPGAYLIKVKLNELYIEPTVDVLKNGTPLEFDLKNEENDNQHWIFKKL